MEQSKVLVMKFGGASVKDAGGVKNVGKILQSFDNQPLLVVVSAMDKTTNQLEKLAWLARDNQEKEAWEQLKRIKDFHFGVVNDIFPVKYQEVTDQLSGYFLEIENIIRGILLLQDFPPRTYDRIVGYGELISSVILFQHLKNEVGEKVSWLDVRNIIRTDARYTQAQVVWTITEENIKEKVKPILNSNKIIVTQGFIASSLEGKTTTLGREGSDYTASIFANCLDAEKLIVWKDVAGVLNADPRRNSNTTKLNFLSYEEAIEMTFYGATVLHPKTIKPLFLKKIPLQVRCFLDPGAEGTIIRENEMGHSPALAKCTIVKENQVLVHIHPRNFSFMEVDLVSKIFQAVGRAGLQVNLVQTTAVSLVLCVNLHTEAIEKFSASLMDEFNLSQSEPKVLTTVFPFTFDDFQSAKGAELVQVVGEKLFVLG